MLLIALYSSNALAEECRLHVDAGSLSDRMVALLAKEVPSCSIVTSSSAATLALAIMREDGHLDVDMTAPPSTPVLSRRVTIDDGDPEPALRRIALLAARAVDSSSQLPPYELSEVVAAPMDEARAWHLSVEGSFVTHWWESPNEATFAPALSLSIDIDDFTIGLWSAWFVKNDQSVNNVRASSTEVALMIRGAWRPLRFGLLSVGVELGAGINIVRLRAKPVIIEGADQTVTTPVEGLFRGGPLLDLALVGDRLHVFLRAGLLLRVPSAGIDFHVDYGTDGPIRTGNYGPYVDGGLALRFF